MKKPHRRTRRKAGEHPAAIEAAPDLSPLDFVLRIMRDKTKPDALRVSMAKAAMPYLHQRAEADAPPQDEPEPKPEWSGLEVARRIAFVLMRADEKRGGREPGNPVENMGIDDFLRRVTAKTG